MRLEKCELDQFVHRLPGKKLYCFGASQMAREMLEEYPELDLEKNIEYFIDNSDEKKHKMFMMGQKSIEIISVEEFCQKADLDTVLLITSRYYLEIFQQLSNYSQLDNIACYIWPMMAPQYKSDPEIREKIRRYEQPDRQISPIIHYIWLGRGEIPDLEKKCMETWHRVCPDYQVIRWDESNYDVTKNVYMREAYEAGKWSFASDYARLDILYQHGGIYLDTDVEILRPLDDLLKVKGFMGFESKNLVAMGLGMGAMKKHPMVKRMMDDYENRHFLRKDGSYDMISCPYIQTALLSRFGLQLNNQLQNIEDMLILPQECLNPDNNMCAHITENSYTRHHFSGTWTSTENRQRIRKMMLFANEREQ